MIEHKLDLTKAIPARINMAPLDGSDCVPKVAFTVLADSVQILLTTGEYWAPRVHVRIHDYRASTFALYAKWRATGRNLGTEYTVYDREAEKAYFDAFNSPALVTIISEEPTLVIRIEDAQITSEFPWKLTLTTYYEGMNIDLWHVSKPAPWSWEQLVGSAGRQTDTIRFTLTTDTQVEEIEYADWCDTCNARSEEDSFACPHTMTIQ